MSAIPTASSIVSEVAAASFDSVLASLKSFDSAELAKLMKAALNELEKKHKSEAKSTPSAKKEKKKGSMMKGRTPTQLLKPRAWVDFVQNYANKNGWEAFSVTDKKNVVTEFAASIVVDGVHVFPESKKPMAMKQAMSLSKIFWAPKESTGSRQDLYNEFNENYVEPVVEESTEPIVSEVAAEAAPVKKARAPKKTDEEKAAEKAEKKKVAAEKKTAEKASKEAESAVKPVATPKKSPAKKVVAEWSCPDDGNVYSFTHKGKNYMRNFDGMLWDKAADGNPGNWVGMWKDGAIDDSVPEPEYDDEE